MPETTTVNPAEVAGQRALEEVFRCIREEKSFRLEAGAGAGKTYSLVKSLQMIIDEKGEQLVRRHQQVACITYTNVATDEVTRRTDGHPVVLASTIHSFCWELCRSYQAVLRLEVMNIPQLVEKINEAGGLESRRISYDLGFRRVTDTEVFLHHDDILTLMASLMERPKFRKILAAKYPILFIDEYQDTDATFANSLIRNFIEPRVGPLVGLFGDSWQKIYRTGAGCVDHPNLQLIGKESNFRSVPDIVNVLNLVRPDLPQQVSNPTAVGSAKVYHTNSFVGQRQTGGHWGGDLPAEAAHQYLAAIRLKLANDGWDFSPKYTKILMLTHNVLAAEQGYGRLLGAFDYNDALLKKEYPHVAFLADIIEPACEAFCEGKFGKMFSVLGRKHGDLTSLLEKHEWSTAMQRLVKLRSTGTIGDVIDLLKKTRKPLLPEAVMRTEKRLEKASREEIAGSQTLAQLEKFRSLQYSELVALAAFINDHTPFATKHGVKGAEFENVLVVLGRGWNQYNWTQFLEWFPNRYPEHKEKSYLRNRNLFYVACSRPKKNLALLFTQKLSADALRTLDGWFGVSNVSDFTP